ncbi:MAG: 1,4-alpha-glucan branching protein GlgB [Bacteroidia bacterium]|nr:1,4-alpha-glucan branching protein GlgB [Bacteroidia bacterium]
MPEIYSVTYSELTDFDTNLFRAGKHFKLYEKMGSHLRTKDGVEGVYFAVYAPAARKVEVIGNFNYWEGHQHPLFVRWDGSGIWEGFIPGLQKGQIYKYKIYSDADDRIREKTDPYARLYEAPPKTASVIWDDPFEWNDNQWMNNRSDVNSLDAPMSIYEVHLGSWKKHAEGRSLHYKELADDLVNYVSSMGFTHIELLPVMEHPFYPSWGYLCTGYFAPSSRYGSPEEFKYLVDAFHRAGIGVILDWVPAHFPSDEYALADFDGTHVYEHPEYHKGFHPDWNSLIFNFERPEICSFLISSAFFWLDNFHIDGLRVDAVASMLYLDYSREEGQWQPNQYGGNEYLAAVDFIKTLNQAVYSSFPGIQMIAEESTAFPGVTTPVSAGGLGFGLKWMMGWMNDTLQYMQRDPIHRQYHHNEISFSMAYAYSENYLLPLSHDEVVHGKNSIIYKMPGDNWQKFANARLLYCYMFTHPGQKLLFMGNEIGQTAEWNVNESVEWHLLDFEPHAGIQNLIRDLNTLYKKEAALTERSYDPSGFEWLDYSDHRNSVLAYVRWAEKSHIVTLLNFTPGPLYDYQIGVPKKGRYQVLLNSDRKQYDGTGDFTQDYIETDDMQSHGRSQSIKITIPPLGALVLKSKNK